MVPLLSLGSYDVEFRVSSSSNSQSAGNSNLSKYGLQKNDILQPSATNSAAETLHGTFIESH